MALPPDSPADLETPHREIATLTPVEVRILGALVEKQITTPDGYPLSLNSLVVACNQTTNREPVTAYDEATVTRALENLRHKGLVWVVTGSRVPKYEHRVREKLELSPPQIAALCVMMLRGPQTAGEIRGRSGRLHPFAGLAEVESTIESLRGASPPLVTRLPRAPGTKEARYAHLLGGEGADLETRHETAEAPAAEASRSRPREEDLDRLEAELAEMRRDLDALRDEVAALRSRIDG